LSKTQIQNQKDHIKQNLKHWSLSATTVHQSKEFLTGIFFNTLDVQTTIFGKPGVRCKQRLEMGDSLVLP
jgi:hypothetical protein